MARCPVARHRPRGRLPLQLLGPHQKQPQRRSGIDMHRGRFCAADGERMSGPQTRKPITRSVQYLQSPLLRVSQCDYHMKPSKIKSGWFRIFPFSRAARSGQVRRDHGGGNMAGGMLRAETAAGAAPSGSSSEPVSETPCLLMAAGLLGQRSVHLPVCPVGREWLGLLWILLRILYLLCWGVVTRFCVPPSGLRPADAIIAYPYAYFRLSAIPIILVSQPVTERQSR
jgi:hypothetical protein